MRVFCDCGHTHTTWAPSGRTFQALHSLIYEAADSACTVTDLDSPDPEHMITIFDDLDDESAWKNIFRQP